MCIAYISIGNEDWPLQIAANRDEFHSRPTSSLRPWDNQEHILAGRDLQAGGTWLGWSKHKKFAFLTNYREPGHPSPVNAPSRGKLVSDFLNSDSTPYSYIKQIIANGQDWAGFNLVLGDLKETWYLTNRNAENAIDTNKFTDLLVHPNNIKNLAGRLKSGDYVISNHLLDTKWPKSLRLKQALTNIDRDIWVSQPEDIFQALHDTAKADLNDLPNTGLSQEFETLLSSPFIISNDYGTRCSSLISINNSGHGLFSEISYDNKGLATERNDWPI